MISPSTVLVLAAVCGPATVSKSDSDPIEVQSLLIRLIEQVDVPAREAGVLQEVLVREGQMVDRDTLLVRIADDEARIVLRRAELELEIAGKHATNTVDVRFSKKSVEVAQAELRRAADSVQKYPKSVSKSEMDRLKLTVERSVLAVEQAEEEYEIAQLTQHIKDNQRAFAFQKLQRRQIVAPITGMVVQINRRRGEWVQPGDSVVRMVRIDHLRAEGFVHVNRAHNDLTGRGVTLRVDLPGQPGAKFVGKIVFVSPEVDPVNSQVRVWAEIENQRLWLRPGLRGSMTINPQ